VAFAVERAGLALALLSLGVASGCGNDESLRLVASPREFYADGATVVQLTANVEFRGEPVDDGKKVLFRANQSLLFDSREDVEPGEGVSEVQVTTRGGKARAYLISPLDEANIRVEGSFTTVNRDVLSDTVLVEAHAPRLISAGRFNLGASEPFPQFGLSCSSRNVGGVDNIGAFVSDRGSIEVPCSLLLQDFKGRDLPNTPVHFYVEAGAIEDLPATDDRPRRVTYVVEPSPFTLPRDVDPISAETMRNLVDFDETGRSVNPRDGMVTILAVVRGHEAYADVNDNGKYDAGEPFLDEGEPFLDIDDDGIYDPTIDPPHCCDSNENGHVDGPNGKFDKNVWIGRMTHILWSGPVDPVRSYITPEGINITAGSTATLALRIVDMNFNPVAAGEVDDEVRFDISPATKIRFDPPPPMSADAVPLPNSIGMALNTYPDFVFGGTTPVLVDLIMDEPGVLFRDFPVILTDIRAAGSTSRCTPATFTFEVEVVSTPAPGLSTRSALITTTGVLEEQPDPCP
jgi:hypothetical protein